MDVDRDSVTLGERLGELVTAVRSHSVLVPRVGMVLGSGLGGLADAIENATAIPFEEIPAGRPPRRPGTAAG